MSLFDTKNLIHWFLQEKRDLPWRNSPSPYAVWVSEVMLQQTQVSVVIPYFERWMQRFPDIKTLANASLDEVIKLWEGLGYYSRARNLFEGAKMILSHHNGMIPDSPEALRKIKGLGPYTIGAILSFAFHQKAATVDGNVVRVLARYFFIEEEISQTKTLKKIYRLTEELLPEDKPWIVSEALIELGALICIKKPRCNVCPIKSSCRAFLEGKAEKLPMKKERSPAINLFRTVTILHWKNELLVKRGAPGQLMHDLHEFPYFEKKDLYPNKLKSWDSDLAKASRSDLPRSTPYCNIGSISEVESRELSLKSETNFSTCLGMSLEEIQQTIRTAFDLEITHLRNLPFQKHTFTKYRVTLAPICFQVKEKKEIFGYSWIDQDKLKELAFSSGHKRLFDSIRKA